MTEEPTGNPAEETAEPTARFYAHSKLRANGSPAPLDEWEPLFTPFDDVSAISCRGSGCPLCETLEPDHGHLNKVAFWTARFALEMFVEGPDRETASRWGYIAGLWHDLGKFSRELQCHDQP
jgi:hypothetical protein